MIIVNDPSYRKNVLGSLLVEGELLTESARATSIVLYARLVRLVAQRQSVNTQYRICEMIADADLRRGIQILQPITVNIKGYR